MYLELRGICKSFGAMQVVRDLTLGVERGELVCLLGSSGCGKTTTLKMIGGFLAPDAGQVLIEGQDVTHTPPERRPVSTVFQSYALFPHLSVVQNVAYGLKYRHVPKREALAQARASLEVVGMAEHADARVDEISGGQQQRVALARSLVLRPKVLLLDEPLSNLDARLRVRMREEIKAIQRDSGVTMVFVTHDQEEAMVLGDRLALMSEGAIRQVGTPEEIYEHPADEFCARFMGTVNRLPVPPGAARGEADARKTGADGPDVPARAVAFRAEDVTLDAAGPYHGRVIGSEFLGFYRHYRIEVETGGAHEEQQGPPVIVARTDRRTVLHVGDEVSFSVHAALDIARESGTDGSTERSTH